MATYGTKHSSHLWSRPTNSTEVSADVDFTGGLTDSVSTTIDLTGANTPAPMAVYQSLRYGPTSDPVSYTIVGLTPEADYLVRLHFAEIVYTGVGDRVFDVLLNGTTVLSYFDIFVAAGGANRAVVQDFAVTADGSGHIALTFADHVDFPQINGIEVFQGTTPTLPTNPAAISADTQISLTWNAVPGATSYKVYRSLTSGSGYSVVGTPTANHYLDTSLTNGTIYYYKISAVTAAGESAQSTEVSATPAALTPAYQMHAGTGTIGSFAPDDFYSGGTNLYSVTTTIDVSAPLAAPMAVYQTQRFGEFSYTLPALVPGASYTVRLHFAETYYATAGNRPADISINGTTVLSDFDVATAAGAINKAIVEEFTAVADGSGNITIVFSTVTDNPLINGVEILLPVPSAATTTYLYDPNGSLLSTTPPDNAVTTYTWDATNRLQSVQLPSGEIATQTYRWDDLRVNQQSSSGIETWTWDGQDVLNWSGPSDPSGGITTATNLMVQGPNLVRAVGADIDGSALNRQFHLDNQGSVQALTGASASLDQDYQLDAWGNPLTENTSDNRSVYLGGLGYWQEPNLGLNYVRARWMDPLTGRWISVDSVPTEPRDLYAANSPTLHTDPTGRDLSDRRDTRPPSQRPQTQSRPTDTPADQSILDKFLNLVNAHAPEIQQFAHDPETVAKDFLHNHEELAWRGLVSWVAHKAFDLGIDNIPDWLGRALPGSLFQTRSQWESVRKSFRSIAPFLEPYPFSSRGILWQGGFVWGIIQGIEEMAPALLPTTVLMHGFQNLQSLGKAFYAILTALWDQGLSKLIASAWKATRNRFFNFFEDAAHKPAFDQGKMAGTIVVNLVATIYALISVIGIVKDLAILIDVLRTSGVLGEMVEALGSRGFKGASEVLKSSIHTAPDGSFYIKGRQTGKAPVDLSGELSDSNTVHPPTDGTGMAPKGQGVAPNAGGDAATQATQQIDATTRRLAGAPPAANAPVHLYNSNINNSNSGFVKFGSTRAKRLRTVLNNRLKSVKVGEREASLRIYIQDDNHAFDLGIEQAAEIDGIDIHAQEYAVYRPSYANLPNQQVTIWLQRDPNRVTVFEELYHYIQDRDTGFSGKVRSNTNFYERDASLQLLAMGRRKGPRGGRALAGLRALLKGTVYAADVEAVFESGWTEEEEKDIWDYYVKHSGELEIQGG